MDGWGSEEVGGEERVTGRPLTLASCWSSRLLVLWGHASTALVGWGKGSGSGKRRRSVEEISWGSGLNNCVFAGEFGAGN